VESFAKTFVPYHIKSLEPEHGKGKVIEFDLEKVLPVVLQATGLYEAAKEQRIGVPLSSDARNITKNLSIIIYGIKIKDRAAVCPITKRPLYIPDKNGKSAQTVVQSYENCIPVKRIIGKETRGVVYAQLKVTFDKLTKEDGLGQDGEGLKPLISPWDAQEDALRWTGFWWSSKSVQDCVYKITYTCCAIKSDDLAVPNSALCMRWCQQ
jgi:hypothetical protein